MGIAAIIVKVMPDSPDTDLAKIVAEGTKRLTEKKAMNISHEEKPVAFGLKAIFFKFAWPEEQDTSIIEEILGGIEDVSSVNIEDYRRAFG